MAFRMGDGFLEFTLRDSAFQRGLGRVEKALTRTRAKLDAVASSASRILLVSGVAIAGIVKLASDAEENAAKFNAVFKEQSATARAFAATMAEMVNRSTLSLEKFLATFQDTFVPLGFARDDARRLSETMTQLTVDLASFNNVAESDALRDLQSAIVGNVETLRKYGIIITQATLDQQLLETGFAGGAKAASEQQKVMARLAIILKSTSDAQGDAARTSGSFANQLRGALGKLAEAGAVLGTIFTTALIPVLQKLSALIVKIGPPLIAFTETYGPLIARIAATVAAIGVMLIILPKLVGAVTAAIVVFKGLAVAMAFTAANPLVALIAGFAALAATMLGVGAAAKLVRGDLGGAARAAKKVTAVAPAIKLPKIELDFPEAPTKAKKKKVAKTLDLALTEEERGIGRAKPGGIRAGGIQASFASSTQIWQNIAKQMNAGRQVRLMEEQTKHQKSMEQSLVDIADTSSQTVELLVAGVPAVAAP